MSGGTRLDRLVLLLDSGSTPSVRLTAARQLASLAATRVSHPTTKLNASTVSTAAGAEDGAVWRGVEGEWAEVMGLVARILPHLQSRSIETRQAASSALSHISRAVGIWDPSSTSPSSTTTTTTSTGESPSTSALDSPSALSLSTFDLAKILSEGSLLLSSSGNEYAKISGLSAEEMARAQQDALAKLGLGLGAAQGGTEDELGIDMGKELASGVGNDAGLSTTTTATTTTEAKPTLPPPRFLPPPKFNPSSAGSLATLVSSPSAAPPHSIPAPIASSSSSTPALPSPFISAPAAEDDESAYAGLSARERNKLKRKRKSEAKSGVITPTPSSFAPSAPKKLKVGAPSTVVKTEGGTNLAGEGGENEAGVGVSGEVVVIDPGAKARAKASGGEVKVEDGEASGRDKFDLEVKEGEWPWKGTVTRLAVGLLSPNWESRHGAALGLREILKLQGGGGGQLVGLTVEENSRRHTEWSDDLSTKLLCVFALDRFGDYVSDQVVAPVRETAAQALATLLPYMSASSVLQVQNILIGMVEQDGAPPSKGLDVKYESNTVSAVDKGKYVWQVRHSGLLGLKYLVAVRGDFLVGVEGEGDMKTSVKVEAGGDTEMGNLVKAEEDMDVDDKQLGMLKGVVDAALLGLRDRDDDVRSAAAATLSPITEAFVNRLPAELELIVGVLWECLGDLKDDLSSSIGGVMNLLAKLLASPTVLTLMQSPAFGYSLSDLIPRLFPFFRHTISTVRLAVLNTILVFLDLSSIDTSWVDAPLLRLLFQNLIVEDRLDVREATTKAWMKCLHLLEKDNSNRLVQVASPHISKWFTILNSPIGFAIDVSLFWSAKVSLSGQGGYVHNVDKAILAQDLSLVSVEAVMRGRVAGAVALGALIATWPVEAQSSSFGELLLGGLASESALRRFLTSTVVEELATTIHSKAPPTTSSLVTSLSSTLPTLLQADPPSTYTEMSLILQRVVADCQALYNVLGSNGVQGLPTLGASFNIVQATQIVNNFAPLVSRMKAGSKSTSAMPALEERKRKIEIAIGYYEATKAKHDRQVFAAMGGAVIALRVIPVKLTPLIRCITNSIKNEDNVDLQARSARSIAAFIDLSSAPGSTARSNPSDKLVKNLCTFLCQDVSKTPIFASTKPSTGGILTLEYKPARGLAEKESKDPGPDSDDVAVTKLVYRGAQLALSELAKRFGPQLLDRVPKLWNCMADSLLTIYASGNISEADAMIAGNDELGQGLIDCLTVLPTSAEKFDESLRWKLTELFPALALATQSKFAIVRYAVARSFAALCNIVPTEGLRHVVESVIPMMNDPLKVDNRRGAIELISHIVELLDVKILPYVIFLVVPVLGRMSDSDDAVRLVATNTFATLIKLVPLEAGLPDPPGFSPDLLAKRQAERDFLMQLLDGSKVEEYKIPIPIEIELRKYQREGVSWLAFLAKYQLHGLLCDDMGLGKTLQSICILASKHFERAEKHKETGSLDTVHLPSLIVCPPTLTGHWQQEIKTYAKNLRPIIYTGPKADRERLALSLTKYDAVIMSYDILRNDIDNLNRIDWHYCILDEGHIIKNGKTKLTQAVKTIRSVHRLILSGTPIQNNVLELWSLFDFLMPGFLGSERAFNNRFGKPIAASRDAKSSSKEQEAGALALEALHKQVLPFLLRRLKEDVLDDLPPKIIQDYYCELSPIQKQLYDDFSKSQAKQVVEGEVARTGSAEKPQHVFQALQYLRKLVNHPALVMKPDIPQHQAILAKLEKGGGKLRDIENAPKLQALRQILLDCGIGTTSSEGDDEIDSTSQHRVLIFCQLKQMLDIVENDLFRTLMPTVTYMRMDGTTDVSKRHAVVQTFNSDPSIDCLLLTTHVGGLGLNLTGADTVIFVEHDWNPMKDLQAMDRAHRLGQKKVVNVYRLIMRGTLEEKIMGLQRFKLNIASSVVTQQNSELSLGTDILDLFEVSSEDAPTSAASKERVGQKAILDSLGDLPPEDEYGDLDLKSFLA